MKQKYTVLIIVVAMSMLDCTGSRKSSDSASSTATSASAKVQSTDSSSASELSDQQIAQALAEVMTSDRQSLLSLQKGGCIQIDYQMSSEKQSDQIFHVNCKSIEGTIEVIERRASTGKTYDFTTDLTFSDEATTSRNDNSFYSITVNKDGTENGSKDFSETFKSSTSSFELSGTSTYDFTPDKDSEDSLAGKLGIESTVYISKNGKDLKYFDITSFGLHKSACGPDKGTLALTNSDESYQITYTGCGVYSIKALQSTDTESFH